MVSSAGKKQTYRVRSDRFIAGKRILVNPEAQSPPCPHRTRDKPNHLEGLRKRFRQQSRHPDLPPLDRRHSRRQYKRISSFSRPLSYEVWNRPHNTIRVFFFKGAQALKKKRLFPEDFQKQP
jgi:hypothetical protein